MKEPFSQPLKRVLPLDGMDPKQGFRHRFGVEEFRKNPKLKDIGKIRKKIKELDKKTQIKVALVTFLCLFILLTFLGWSFVNLAFAISAVVGSIISYWYTRDNELLIIVLVTIVALACGILAQY